MTDIFFQILSPFPLDRHEDARKLFQLWAENLPGFLPDRWGLYEPLRNRFSLSTLEEAIRTWELSYYVKRIARPKLQSSIHMQYGPHRSHSRWTIDLNKAEEFVQPAFQNLLERSATVFSADLGYIHRITEAETPRGRANGTVCFLDTAKTEKVMILVSLTLQKFLPDIYWTTVFGKPYVKLFSRERLLSCPAHRVKELDNGSILVQLTSDLQDVVTEEAAFERARRDARAHLGHDAFFDPAKGMDHQYRVPEFEWGPIFH